MNRSRLWMHVPDPNEPAGVPPPGPAPVPGPRPAPEPPPVVDPPAPGQPEVPVYTPPTGDMARAAAHRTAALRPGLGTRLAVTGALLQQLYFHQEELWVSSSG